MKLLVERGGLRILEPYLPSLPPQTHIHDHKFNNKRISDIYPGIKPGRSIRAHFCKYLWFVGKRDHRNEEVVRIENVNGRPLQGSTRMIDLINSFLDKVPLDSIHRTCKENVENYVKRNPRWEMRKVHGTLGDNPSPFPYPGSVGYWEWSKRDNFFSLDAEEEHQIVVCIIFVRFVDINIDALKTLSRRGSAQKRRKRRSSIGKWGQRRNKSRRHRRTRTRVKSRGKYRRRSRRHRGSRQRHRT